MSSYIMAMNISSKAREKDTSLAQQITMSLEAFADSGVKVHNLFATLGRYDCLAVFETDDQETAFKVASRINSLGVLETETWPVIPFDDFTRLLR